MRDFGLVFYPICFLKVTSGGFKRTFGNNFPFNTYMYLKGYLEQYEVLQNDVSVNLYVKCVPLKIGNQWYLKKNEFRMRERLYYDGQF